MRKYELPQFCRDGTFILLCMLFCDMNAMRSLLLYTIYIVARIVSSFHRPMEHDVRKKII